MVTVQDYCLLDEERIVKQYTLENRKGEKIQLLNYGASIQGLFVQDREGVIGDCVLGSPDGEHLTLCTYLGSVIGRCANRIAYGKCTIDGKEYQLETNMRGHFLHGASGNYAKKVFSAEINCENNQVSFFLKDYGEGGFDCSVDVSVEYSFDDESRLTMKTTMVPNGTTVLNPTNHTYFHLGETDIRNLGLEIPARYMVTRGEQGLPNGGRRLAKGTPADFSVERTIGEGLAEKSPTYFGDKLPGYDEFYLLDDSERSPAAVLKNYRNGRMMRILTDLPCLVFFANGSRKREAGKNGSIYQGYCGVALEPEFVPNAVNCHEYDSPVFRAGERLVTQTVYEFGIF